jgi:hypothetical protein
MLGLDWRILNARLIILYMQVIEIHWLFLSKGLIRFIRYLGRLNLDTEGWMDWCTEELWSENTRKVVNHLGMK